jgi:predicted O-linked N-acetylglucosamine transferase (SPINDLY family)
VQVTYLGYPATTGVETMDYRLTDVHADPPELAEVAQRCHSEQLVRLSPTAWCFQMPVGAPLDVRDDGPLTFGCFNNFAKVSESMLRLWCRIVQQVPESRLLLKSNGLGSESVRRRVRQLLDEEGIGSERTELLGPTLSHADHVALYRRMDIALDTFPYHGTTTTCEALWMGVPVVTLAGPSHVSRVGVSLLNNVDLAELVAHSDEEYIEIARNLATDLPRLAELRATLRSRMEASPLMDAPRLARNIEAEYRQMWRTWCARA